MALTPTIQRLLLILAFMAGLSVIGLSAWVLQADRPWLSDALLLGAAALIVGLIRVLQRRQAAKNSPTLVLERVQPRTGFTEDVVLHVAASLDSASPHPVARAIATEIKRRGLPVKPVEEFRHHEGFGVTGKVDGRIIAMGSHLLMKELGVDINVNQDVLAELQKHGAIVVFVSINSYYAGLIVIRTILPPGAVTQK